MRNFVEPARYRDVLRDWRGAGLMVWLFEATFRRLTLRLYRSDLGKPYIYVGIIGCRYYRAPFDWEAACIEMADIEQSADVDANYVVRDRVAGVEIRTSSVMLFLDEEFHDPSQRSADVDEGSLGP